MGELESREAIREASRRLLVRAAVKDELPTPVEKIVAAANLQFGSDDLFADQTLQRAGEIGEKVRALRGKLNALLDRRERLVYLNPEIQLVGRRNFHALHEVGHHWLDWQRDLVYADDQFTLSRQTHIIQEREAHAVAADLLFQCELFDRVAAEYRIGMAEIVELSQMFGASRHATFRRFAEQHRAPVAGVVLQRSPRSVTPLVFGREDGVASPAWREAFEPPSRWPKLLSVDAYPFLAEVARLGMEESPIKFTTSLADLDGKPRELNGELISNHYKLLVLLWLPRRERLSRRRVLAPEGG
jgi:hypothetical protein